MNGQLNTKKNGGTCRTYHYQPQHTRQTQTGNINWKHKLETEHKTTPATEGLLATCFGDTARSLRYYHETYRQTHDATTYGTTYAAVVHLKRRPSFKIARRVPSVASALSSHSTHQNRTIHAVGNNTHNGACRIIPQHVYQQAQRHQLSLLPLVPFGVEGRR